MQIKVLKSVPAKTAEYSYILCMPGQEAQIQAILTAAGIHHNKQTQWSGDDNRNMFYDNERLFIIQGTGATNKIKTEKVRRWVFQAVKQGNELKKKEIHVLIPGIDQVEDGKAWISGITESLLLSNYQFLKYRTGKNLSNSLKSASVLAPIAALQQEMTAAQKTAEATIIARNLVNEPVITLTAEALGQQAKLLATQYGFKAEVWNKKKIEAMKMGGLLAVNTGSPNPPTFTILEWKPAKTKNKKPIVFVGKGVVYDTGGLSLKPTPNSMDSMKSDMAGAAAVIGAFCAIASQKLPYHVVGLIPATDNRPGGNAYTPGDVITMMNGSTVEVLNTDAEGRMILADALTQAKKYTPEVVVDLATLTGAAVVAVGHIGIAMMSTASDAVVDKMKQAGDHVHERVVQFPLWDEYDELLKSDIADQKNIGGPYGGSITAAKFLQAFTDYPWIHLDIAGPAFLPQPDHYRSKNGTGVGVRLLVDFLKQF